jgi:hypothetical protein
MKIRRTKKKDLDQLAALFEKYRVFYKQDLGIKSAKAFLKNRMKRKESVIFVAEEEKKQIQNGCCCKQRRIILLHKKFIREWAG